MNHQVFESGGNKVVNTQKDALHSTKNLENLEAGQVEWIKVMYQTRETVFRWDIQTPRRELKRRQVVEYF